MKSITRIFKKVFSKKIVEETINLPNLEYKHLETANVNVRYSVCGEYTHLTFPNTGVGLTVASCFVKGISPSKYAKGWASGTHHGIIYKGDVEEYVLSLKQEEIE